MRLSICIPTYNRAGPLRQLLDSIKAQRGHTIAVDVVISDNASTDDTEALVNAFIRDGMPITYTKLPENLGFDRNIINVVDMATGDYCWLFGSDDIFEDGAFRRAQETMTRYPEVTGISVGANSYDSELSKRIVSHDHISKDFRQETVLKGRDAIVEGVGPWGLGYISSIIVQRRAWNRAMARFPIDDYCNGYVHIYVLARALDERSTWVCIPDCLIGNRSGNDQAGSSVDEFKRTRLDIVGFDQSFGDALGRRNRAYRETMRKVATFYIRSHFLKAKADGASLHYWRQAVAMSVARYWRYPSFWTKTFPIAFVPRVGLNALKKLRKNHRRPDTA